MTSYLSNTPVPATPTLSGCSTAPRQLTVLFSFTALWNYESQPSNKVLLPLTLSNIEKTIYGLTCFTLAGVKPWRVSIVSNGSTTAPVYNVWLQYPFYWYGDAPAGCIPPVINKSYLANNPQGVTDTLLAAWTASTKAALEQSVVTFLGAQSCTLTLGVPFNTVVSA